MNPSLAKRSGEPALAGTQKASFDDWIERANRESHLVLGIKRADTFSPLQKKGGLVTNTAPSQLPSGRRGVRTVPFSRDTFEQITCSFHTHGSVARVVSRSDVPVFTCDKVNMTETAYGMRSLSLSMARINTASIQLSIFECMGDGPRSDRNSLS